MDKELLNCFLKDLVLEIQGKYNETLIPIDSERPEDKSYRLGCNYAYYDVLDLIHSQLKAFGIEGDIGSTIPELGKKI